MTINYDDNDDNSNNNSNGGDDDDDDDAVTITIILIIITSMQLFIIAFLFAGEKIVIWFILSVSLSAQSIFQPTRIPWIDEICCL